MRHRLNPQHLDTVKHSILLTGPNGGNAYLSHQGKTAFSPATARKYRAEWLECNKGEQAVIVDQFGDPVKPRRRLNPATV